MADWSKSIMAAKPELKVEWEQAEDEETACRLTLSANVSRFHYEYQIRLAAKRASMSEAEYLRECLIYGIEKGLG